MNGRIESGDTPEARIAAVVVSVLKARREHNWWKLDYADFEEALRPYVERELINAKLEELRNERNEGAIWGIARERSLFQKLAGVEQEIAGIQVKGEASGSP